MLTYFMEKADGIKARNIMMDLSRRIDPYIGKISGMLETEGAVIPVGFMKLTEVLLEGDTQAPVPAWMEEPPQMEDRKQLSEV